MNCYFLSSLGGAGRTCLSMDMSGGFSDAEVDLSAVASCTLESSERVLDVEAESSAVNSRTMASWIRRPPFQLFVHTSYKPK